jgi:menaquinone-dependent protoporphyrinogen oxidase
VLGVALAAASTSGCNRSPSEATSAATPSASYGKGNIMGSKILVGYATRTGSTVGVAEEIGRTLADRGFTVDVRPLKDSPSLAGYDAAVVGSAINGANWLPEAKEYAQANAALLGELPLAVFCVHGMNTGPGEKKRKKRLAYIDDIRELVSPEHEGYFAGTGLDPEETSKFEAWAFRTFGGDVEGDGRDWPKIRAWAEELAL